MPAKKATTTTKRAARSARKTGGRTRKQVRRTAKRATSTTRGAAKQGTKKGSRRAAKAEKPIELPSTFLPGQSEAPAAGERGSKAPAPVPPSSQSQQPADGSDATQTLLDYLLGS